MKGFIEITRKGTDIKQLINVSHIIHVIGHDIMTEGILDNGYGSHSDIVSCVESYKEILDMLEEESSR